MKWEEFKNKLMEEPAFHQAYDDLEPEYQLIKSIIEQRKLKGISQAELARKAGTRQSAIARLESGTYNPSLRFLKKVARALDAKIEIKLK
ncbi:helix-turn-helix domain-containing protein [Neomoorella thermoacetica]|uniref:helix-turn-helix domain-containing protein n=1 Tax=Neomoorella thermoacetica TaxID=1525 RepID=UPI0008FB79A5|nr:helix-turn-helix transcriptional regulator [Moorella thermoacetica]OIQ59943.1 antitoxin HigA [Moorella thermoacetica]